MENMWGKVKKDDNKDYMNFQEVLDESICLELVWQRTDKHGCCSRDWQMQEFLIEEHAFFTSLEMIEGH